MDAASRDEIGAALLADNELTSDTTPDGQRVSGAALVGLWLLIPAALGGAGYALVGLISMLTVTQAAPGVEAEQAAVAWQWWLLATVLLQSVYWVLIAPRPMRGLWALLPVLALIPTFGIARDVLLRPGSPGGRRNAHLLDNGQHSRVTSSRAT